MPHRFTVSVAEARLLRHALARATQAKMQRNAAPAADHGQPPPVAEVDLRPDWMFELNSRFKRSMNAWGSRPQLRPWPSWSPYPGHQAGLASRAFHTGSWSRGPQFPDERHAVMQPREAAATVKRSWEDDGRAAFSADRNQRRAPADRQWRHQRSKSYDDGREGQERALSEAELSADVRRLRRWELTEFGIAHAARPMAGVEFTVATYNVLAQCLLEDNSYLYQHCDPDVLTWEFRKLRILGELKEANVDVLCLQEIQSNHYEDFFVPELAKLGYTGRYKKRTGDKSDGCAIFYKAGAFALDGCTSVEYSRPGMSLLDRDNIALVAMLRPLRGGPSFCVANTHLLFNPGRGDIKLAQLQILLAEIDRFAYSGPALGSRDPLYHPVILCGDMNSEPNCSLYEFVSTGALHYEGLMAGDISGQADGCRKGRFALAKELIPEQLGISDQCQYVDDISRRLLVDHAGGDAGLQRNNALRASTQWVVSDNRPTNFQDGRPVADDTSFGLQPTSGQDPQALVNSGHAGSAMDKGPHLWSANVQKTDNKDGRPEADNIYFGRQMESASSTVDKGTHLWSGNVQKTDNKDVRLVADNVQKTDHRDGRPIADNIFFGRQTESGAEPRGLTNPWRAGSMATSSDHIKDGRPVADGPELQGPDDLAGKDGQAERKAAFATGRMTHGLNFVSAYGHRLHRTRRSTAAVTTHHRRGSCMVDYIFYTVRSKETSVTTMDGGRRVVHRHAQDGPLSLLATHGLMSCHELTRLGGLPNRALPSDHLKLMARFLLRGDS